MHGQSRMITAYFALVRVAWTARHPYYATLRLKNWLEIARGVALAAAIALLATFAAEGIGAWVFQSQTSPVSPIIIAILLGMAIANVTRLPESFAAGLNICTTLILRIGIMLLGIRLSLFAASQFTLIALPFVALTIAVALVLVGGAARRIGLSKRLGGLIAIGTSVCGATAIVAVAPMIRAKASEVSYAIGCITLFGVIAMFAYPFIAHAVFAERAELAGLFLGTSIHETAQVVGAGIMYEAQFGAPAALDSATVTKLVRNLGMIALIPLVGVLYGEEQKLGASKSLAQYLRLIPWFIVGFVLFSAVRTIGDHGSSAFGVLDKETWAGIVAFVRASAESLLLLAMAAVGLNTRFASMKTIGFKPLALALFAALVVGGVSLGAISAAN